MDQAITHSGFCFQSAYMDQSPMLQRWCAYVVGADALKDALTKLGLKCGGTLRQRAERLLLTKTTPLEKLDRKLFAKGVVPAVSPASMPLCDAAMQVNCSFTTHSQNWDCLQNCSEQSLITAMYSTSPACNFA